ncbi:tetratricopeptide repeat protein [uncultured Methanospirillum sp.]|uniref:tetratricopeptide repeat protein n=1 Tax=uncultured Methanospirillum sp. TaxID=262503 RepID=UPI0029C89F02|nr:tetratricopeptide repeat protein [uncultured Methanospirillum sp.]
MKNHIFISAVLLVMAVFIAGVSAETVEDYMAKGAAFDNQQRYTQAIDSYDLALQLNASNLNAQFCKSLDLYKAKRLSESLDNFKKTTDLDPKNATAWYYQGKINEELGNKDDALDANNKARMLGYIV